MSNMTVKYSKKIYSRATIERAIRDYEHLAEIKLEEDALDWSIVFSKSKVEEGLLQGEFDNYLIGLLNGAD